MIKVYILIPVYNRLLVTSKGINAIKNALTKDPKRSAYEKIEYKIIVIDDGSTDGTSDWIEQNHNDIIVLRGDGNLWWSGSINLALNYLKSQKYDFVLLWNDDIKPDRNYFKILSDLTVNKNLSDKIISSKVLWNDGNNTLFNAGCLFNPITGKKTILGLNQKDNGKFDDFVEIDWCGGMGVLIPKKVIKKVGLFDAQNFPQYHGDADYMLRAKKHGFQLFVEPRLKVYNNKESTGSSNNSLKAAFKSIRSLGSNYNIKKDIKFYKCHSESPQAYFELLKKYARFFLGAVKNTLK